MSDRMLTGTRKGLFLLDRRDGEWSISGTHFLGDPVTMVLSDRRDGALYAALDHGHFGVKLHRSDDAGGTWQEVATPEFPKKPEDPDDPHPWRLSKVWSLAAGGAGGPGGIWCGTIPGGLFVSDDRGASWALVRPLWDRPERRQWFGGGEPQPGIHSICVDPRDSARVLVGVSCGGVWETTDGGETWALRAEGMRADYMPPERKHEQNIQDPHCVVMCPAQPDALWAQHHNGIFRSTDGARTWAEVPDATPSVFGFAVAVHPGEPGTAWFVPAVKDEKRYPVDGKVVVSRTRDGGRTFDVLRTGLPQEHAYDVTFRHGLDVDRTGERLAFGSTTGSLWTSEDHGDTWLTVSEHLPPVYVVRFV